MRAIVTDGTGTVREEFRDRPEPDAGEALVRIEAVGICGSDVGLIHGEGPPWTEYPLVPGHEVCGVVAEVGEGVESVAIGDRVALHGFVYCGTCDPCRDGRYYQCDELREVGFTIDGGYREYAALPAYTLVPLPDDVSDVEATQIDSAACTLHALDRVSTAFDDVAAVHGPGSLGLYAVQLLRSKGVSELLVAGLRRERLDVADRYGASATIDITETDPVSAIRERTDGRGVDLSVETAGGGDVVDACLRTTAKGGDVVLSGVFDEKKSIDPNDIVAKELSVYGSVTASHAVEGVIELFRRGELSIDGIVTHEFGLEEFDRALDVVENRRDGVIKAILRPGE